MSTIPWKFIVNTFYSRTFQSMKNALSLTQDHLAKLTANETDADILAIKTAYLPLHTAFITANNQLDSRLGIYKGKTQTFEEMLEELSKVKINEWRGQVFAVFPEGTDNATAIFPRDRQPFQSDTYDERVEAVNTGKVRRAALKAIRHIERLHLGVGVAARSACDERVERFGKRRREQHCTNARRPAQPLVRGDTERVDVHRGKIDRNVSSRLRRVDREEDAVCAA